MQLVMQKLDSALFLDRDGVINRQIVGDYVRNISQFEWLPGAVDAIVKTGTLFRYVIVVTNQQGIGKGLMSVAEVTEIHDYIIREVRESGGRLDKIYCCPSLDSDNDPNRKPGTGMGMQAKQDFPEIEFNRSLMVGDSLSDMQFAERLGMQRIFVTNGRLKPENVKYTCDSLAGLPYFLDKHNGKIFI